MSKLSDQIFNTLVPVDFKKLSTEPPIKSIHSAGTDLTHWIITNACNHLPDQQTLVAITGSGNAFSAIRELMLRRFPGINFANFWTDPIHPEVKKNSAFSGFKYARYYRLELDEHLTCFYDLTFDKDKMLIIDASDFNNRILLTNIY